ncbi:MAG: iron-containing redox enzyme family protein [Luteolibacter sp.]
MSSIGSLTVTEASAVASLSAAPILGNEYFRTLADGSMPRAEFVRSQVQFFYAVGFFSRNLATLIARLPTSAGRAVLVHNLSEEHGLDEEHPADGFRAQFAHDRTFARFLNTLGVGAEELAASLPATPVQAFNLALLGACGSESTGFALSALGMIEYAFADISALIGRRVVELGWVKAGELVHYSLHAEIDKRHAAELFEAAEKADNTSEPTVSILSGLSFGRYIFDRLYMDLIREKP